MEIFNILYIYIYIYIDAAEAKLVSMGLAQARPNYISTGGSLCLKDLPCMFKQPARGRCTYRVEGGLV